MLGHGRCVRCGAEFERTRKDRKYCSFECRRADYEDRERAKRQHVVACLYCGKEFVGIGDYRKYCSPECSYKARMKNHGEPVTKVCANCGKRFTANTYSGATQKFCSDECGYDWWARFNSSTKAERICKACGKPFVGPQHQAMCSKCQWQRWKDKNPAKARKIKARCRAIRRQAEVAEDIDPEAVYERDGWKCGICGRKVNPKTKFPHPMSATLDHIIPLAKGGTHTWDNVQCAHYTCNCRKRTSGSGQLRLVL